MLTCGLIGLPGSGKSTIFALLSGANAPFTPSGSGEARRVVRVPDPRVDTLAEHFSPKKVTYAQLEVTDVPGLVPGERSRTAHFLEAVRESDALIFVLRDFGTGSDAAETGGAPNPVAELGTLEAELILADLAMVESRIERLESGGKKGGSGGPGAGRVDRKDAAVHAALVRVRDGLSDGVPLSEITLEPDEREALAHTSFLSSKPAVWVLNVAEADLATAAEATGLAGAAAARGVPLVVLSAQVEREIAELPPEEAAPFLADLGLTESGTSRLARAVYRRLGLISFLTTGSDEVRAWTIRRGTRAREAAGKVHSDMERGFIRAEVVAFSDYLRAVETLGPSPARAGGATVGERALVAAREKALMHLEGKDYEVKDGDIVSFRFNV